MASLLGWVKKEASAVYHGFNPIDHGQGWTSRPPQKPLPQYQRPVQSAPQQGQLQVGPVHNPTLAPPVPSFHVIPTANLNVGVATPRPLNVGNIKINPTQTGRTQTPARNAFLQERLHPDLASQVKAGLEKKLVAPMAAAQTAREMFLPSPAEINKTYQTSKQGKHPGLAPLAAALQASAYIPETGVVAKGVKTIAKDVKLPTTGLTQLDQSGKIKLPNLGGRNQSFHYTAPTNGYTKVSGKASDVRSQLTKLNEYGGVGKNVPKSMPKDFLEQPGVPKIPKEFNPKVTAKLSQMPAPKPELPPTPPTLGRDLPSMQEVPGINKAFSNKVNVLRKINTPSSHGLADLVQGSDKTSESLRAGYMAKIPTVQKLNNKETAQLFDVVEKKLPTKNVSPKVQQAAKEWQKLTPEIHQNAFHQGAIIGERQNYVPHSYDPSFWTKQKGSQYDSAIQHLMDTKQIDHTNAVHLFENLSAENARRPAWFGNFENARMTDLPGYTKNKDVLYRYIQGAANRTAQAKHFGLDNQVANKLLTNVRIEGGDVNAATKAMENYLRSADRGTGSKSLQAARGFFGAARLGKAGLSHAGQTSNVVVDTTPKNALAGWGRYLSRNKADKDFVARTGVTNPQVLHAYQDQFTSVRGAMSKVTAPVLTPIMRVNRSVSALAYRGYGNFLANKGELGELRKLGVTGDVGKTLTPAQELEVARGGVNRTMFNPSRATTPTYAETPAGKTVGQYRTAYTYKQTGFIHDRIIKEARNGNLRPLIKYLGVSAPIAGGTIAVKNKISGRNEGPGGVASDVAGALGGIPGEIAMQLARYGKHDLPKTVGGIIAPLAGEAVDLTERGQKAIGGNIKPLERYVAGLPPVVGNRLSKALVPPTKKKDAGTNTAANSPTGKKLTVRQLKGNNPDELIRWQGMTARARKNVQTANPDKYIRDQNLKIQQEHAQGKTTDAFKDQRDVGKVQIYKGYDKNLVGAYNLKQVDFNAFVKQASADDTNKLHQLDKQLLDKGLIAKSKFPKAKTLKTGGSRVARGRKSNGSRGSKSSGGSFRVTKISSKKPAAPKGVKVKKVSYKGTLKTRKLSVGKMPKIS